VKKIELKADRRVVEQNLISIMTTFPKARIPTDPILSANAIRCGIGQFLRRLIGPKSIDKPTQLSEQTVGKSVASVLDAGTVLHVTSGRMAIGLALLQMQISAGDEILMPAYHSRSMVEPVVWLSAVPVFYQVRLDTSADLDDLTTRITERTKVLVVINYFGFPQDLHRLRQLCDAKGILMLEDCAHAFMGEYDGKALGSFGDYAIASTMKLFPVYDGGCLVSSRHPIDAIKLVSAGIVFECKTALNTLERAFAYDRLPLLKMICALPIWIKTQLWKFTRSRTKNSDSAIGPRASDGAFGFEPSWLDKRASSMSRFILNCSSIEQIAATRRLNYQRLQTAWCDLPECRPLYTSLPPGVVPWVFPLLVERPEIVFPALKNAGVPVIRFGEFLWDDVNISNFENSVELSQRVMQFPCHQALRESEIAWMIEQVRTILMQSSTMLATP
jgi:perosamine synthetase